MKKPSSRKSLKKKSKRGGPRPGAGRKPKPRNPDEAPKSKMRPHQAAQADAIAMAAREQTELARKFAKLAITTFADVAKNAQSESARIAAAKELLAWGYGKPLGIGEATMRPSAEKPAKEKPLGKKEALVQSAKNPDQSTAMGGLMAQRTAQAKLNS